MQVSTSVYNFRIPTQLRTVLDDTPYPAGDDKQQTSSSIQRDIGGDLSPGSAQTGLQSALVANALNSDGDASTSSSGHAENILDSLSPSDIKLITDATGSTYTNGELVGGNGIDSSDLQIALYALRTTGTGELGSPAIPVTGDITADQLRAVAAHGMTVDNYSAINKALDILDSQGTPSGRTI